MARRVCVKGDAADREGREKVRQWNKRGVWMDSSCVIVEVVVVAVGGRGRGKIVEGGAGAIPGSLVL